MTKSMPYAGYQWLSRHVALERRKRDAAVRDLARKLKITGHVDALAEVIGEIEYRCDGWKSRQPILPKLRKADGTVIPLPKKKREGADRLNEVADALDHVLMLLHDQRNYFPLGENRMRWIESVEELRDRARTSHRRRGRPRKTPWVAGAVALLYDFWTLTLGRQKGFAPKFEPNGHGVVIPGNDATRLVVAVLNMVDPGITAAEANTQMTRLRRPRI